MHVNKADPCCSVIVSQDVATQKAMVMFCRKECIFSDWKKQFFIFQGKANGKTDFRSSGKAEDNLKNEVED